MTRAHPTLAAIEAGHVAAFDEGGGEPSNCKLDLQGWPCDRILQARAETKRLIPWAPRKLLDDPR